MDTRPTNRRSRRLFLVFIIGLALVGLALAIPLSLASDAEVAAATLAQPLPIADSPPQGGGLPPAAVGDLPLVVASSAQPLAPLSPLAPLAGPTNGGFETGDLTGWTVSGSAARVEALQATNFTPNITPPEGTYMALLCTGPGAINGTPQGNIDGDLNGNLAYDTSILSQILNLTERDVPATLIFDWSFLTSEGTRAPDPYDDFFRVRLGNEIILAGSKPGGISPFTDVSLTQPGVTVTSAGSTNNCQFVQGRTSFGTFRKLITNPGTYTLEFLVADEGDNNIDSGLLIDNVRLIPEIDLAITKTARPDPAIAGEPLIYEITVTNLGTGRARNVIVTDTLPLEVEFITDTLPNYVTDTLPSGCTFSAGSGPSGEDQLFCGLGDILGGESVVFQIEVDVDSNALANGTLALVNKAEVTAEPPDRNLRNNTFLLETVLRDLADLRVVKVSKPDTSVRAGEIFTYTIFVDNLGPSHARNVVLTDTILSSGAFTLLSVTPDPNRLADSCTTTSTVTSTLIICTLGESLEPQGDPPRNGRWMIQVQVRANQAQDVNNEVFVFSADPDGPAGPQTATPDPDLSNNRATDFISVLATADLHLTKIGQDAGSNPDGNPYTVLAGESITWTLVISNSGPSTAENVAVVDVLPRHIVEGSVSVVAVTPPIGGGQCVIGTPGDPNEPLICNVGNLLPNQYAVVTITADIDPSFVAEQPNTAFANYLPNDAYLTSDTFDPDTDDNIVYDALVEVLAQADLVVAKIDHPSSVRAGDPLNYSITISNTGPSTAEDTMLVDQLPAGVTFLNATVLNGLRGSVCEYAVGARQVVCSLGDLPPSPPTVTLLINTLVNSDTPPGPMTNTVTVASVTPDPNLANNTATATTDVATQVDLEINKTSDPDLVYAGEILKYSITVVNLGPSDAVTVTVTDTLPVSLTYQLDTDHCYVAGTTPAGAQVLLCRYGRQIGPDFVYDPLPPGGVWQFDIYALVDPALLPGTIITNTAFVTSANSLGDSNMQNNTATSKSLVEEKADLKIVKFGKPEGQVRAGEILTYTVIVDNLGPSWATSVALKDVLQASKDFDLIDIESDRAAVCSALVAGTTRVYTDVLVGPNPWPPVTAPPPFGVIPPTGISNINQHLQIDCTLENTASPAVGDGRLEVLEADGPPNSGRWILTIRVRAPQTQDINNIADVVSAAFDPDPGNNHAEVMHEITDVADLAVTKNELGEVTVDGCPPGVSLLPNQVTAGLSLTYTLVVTNNGPSPAENTVLEDRLPPWLVVTGYTATQGECSTGTPGSPADKLRCGLGTIEWQGVVTVTVTARVPSWVPHGTILENDVLVYSDIFDPTNANNFASNLTTVSAAADLALDKSAIGEVVTGYNTNTFSDVVENRDGAVTAGKLLKFTLTVTNNGPSDAQGVVVTDTLPDRTFVLISSHGAVCRADPIAPTQVTCQLGTVPAGEVRVVELLVQTLPDAANPDPINDTPNERTVTNRARVSSSTHDPCEENNPDDAEVRVNAVANLLVIKRDAPDPVLAGEEVRYVVTAQNLGPSKSRDVRITDTLPNGLVFVRCEPVDPDDVPVCTVAGQVVTLTDFRVNGELRDDLLPGETRRFAIVAYARSNLVKDPDIYGQPDAVGNRVTVTDTVTIGQAGDISDFYTANNTDNERTGATSAADLAVRKTDTPSPTPDGGYLTYDPVTNSFVYTYYLTIENLGPSDAGRVILEDTLPAFASLDGDPASAISAPGALKVRFRDDGTVIVDYGQIAGNDGRRTDLTLSPPNPNLPVTRTLTIRVRVDANVAPGISELRNVVRVYTVAGNVCPANTAAEPCVPIAEHGYTPTPDPDLRNNVYVEVTTLVAPKVAVDKKAYVRRSPARGIDNSGLDPVVACANLATDDILALPGDEVTYCYTITNEGDTWLSSITLSDTSSGIVRTPLGKFTVAYPSKPPLRGTVSWNPPSPGGDLNEAQTITIATVEPEVAVLAPKGVPDDYDHILIIRSFKLDFPGGAINALGFNTATVTAIASTKYSTVLPGATAASDTDRVNDTLAVPVLEETTKDWRIFEDLDLDGLPSPGDAIEYVVDIPNTGIIEATGVEFYDGLYNYIANDPNDPRVPALLINGSVTAAIHVSGRDPITGWAIEKDLQPPDLAFGQDILLRTQAPGIDLTYPSAIVLAGEILKGNTPGDDEIHVMTRLPIPPKGLLLRFDGVTYDPPIPVTFSLRITYKVRVKETVPVDTIVLNHGWVYYREIDLFDQRFPQFNPANPNQYFNSNRIANNHAGTPGRAWETVEFPGWPEIPVGVEPTNYPGPRFDLYARPGAAIRDDDDPTWFKVEREAPSIGGDSRIQLPVLNRIDDGKTEQTLIEIQNVGRADTVIILFLWDDYSAGCAAQSPGPKKAECSGLLKPGASWQWQLLHLPKWARSGIAYSVQTGPLPAGFTRPNLSWPQPYPGQTIDEYMCAAAQDAVERNPYDPWDDHPYYAWRSWEEFWKLHFQGQPVAIEVDRIGMSAATGAYLSGGYEGFSRDMEGVENPVDGGYGYYSPVVYANFEGLTTWLYIQNSGDRCASVDIWLYAMDNCNRPRVCEIEQLSPGESYPLDVLGECGVGPGFIGSAYLRSAEPLGIVVDHIGDEVLLTHRAVPAELNFTWGEPLPWYTAGSQVNYGPLVYREYLGWDSKIFVQNLSSIVAAKVKVYFLDNSGDIITTLVDWICPRGTQEFFLPLVNSLPGNYVGAVWVESQDWWSPGDPPVPFPNIMSVAQLIKYEGPAKAEMLEGIAYNLFGEDEAFDWQTGEIETWGVRRIALPSLRKENKNLITDIAVQNVVPKPGFTDFIALIYDQNGLVGSVCEKLNEKQVEYIRLEDWGYIAPAFRGSAVISATYWNHKTLDSNGQVRYLVGLAAVRVVRSISATGGDIPGDESMGTQGFPIHRPFGFMPRVDQPLCQP